MLDPPIILPLMLRLRTEFLPETLALHTTLNLVAPKGGVIPPPMIPMCMWSFMTLLSRPTALT